MSSTEEIDILAKLERLSTQVQQAANHSSAHLDNVLRDAIHTTSNLLKSSLPGNVGEPWLQELSKFSGESKRESGLEGVDKAPSIRDDRLHKNTSTSAVHVLAPTDSISAAAEKTQEGFEQTACVCGTLFSLSPNSKDSSQPKPVTCIHGCGHLFHSSRCRRKHIQAHAHDCPALQRKKVLKLIGLSPDPDLF